jgi:pimeloyl-ACP methyl ester carboxylesterase
LEVRLIRLGIPALALAAVVAAAFAAGPKPSLQVTEMGAGGATMVLVHGMGGTRTDWLPLLKRLKDRYKLVMVELPGHGTSPLPEPFSLEAAAEQVDSVLALQKPESTIVVGHGLGGMLALKAMARHPGRARGLVLIDAALKSPIPVEDQQIKQLVRFMDENYATFSQMAFARMGRDSAESAILFAKMSAVPPVTVKSFMRNLLLADANGDLKSLGLPVQLVLSDRMWKSDQTWGEAAKRLGYEDTTLAVPRRVANTGMLMMKDQPDTLAAILAGYGAARLGAAK